METLGALLAVTMGLGAAPPGEGSILVSPEIVEVSPERPWADVTVRSRGDAPREVQASVLAWSQDEAGRVVLEPAVDASMFPRAAVVAPAEARRFRLTVVGPAEARERAYRISLSVRDVASGARVTALVPAFVAPVERTVARTVRVACERARCRVVLSNPGSVRVRPERVSVELAHRGGAREELLLEPWWVLAGGTRVYVVELPAAAPVEELVARVTVGSEELEDRARVPD